MQIFSCPACHGPVQFTDLTCTCGAEVAFDPAAQSMIAADAPCRNRLAAQCNWTAPGGDLCPSCAMTRTIPDLAPAANLSRWIQVEAAKRWVLACLMRLDWFTATDPGPRPVFDLMAEDTADGPVYVITGHEDGVITLNASEADASLRTARAEALGESYRTLIGHVRHEMAHFLHYRLQSDAHFIDSFRTVFGDERADYDAALMAHYNQPQPPGDQFITAYATAHPHEDWAETTAHLLHLLDIDDSVSAAGLSLAGSTGGADPYTAPNLADLLGRSAAQARALNHVNRCMGLSDLYPFTLTAPVRDKLAFVHRHLRRT